MQVLANLEGGALRCLRLLLPLILFALTTSSLLAQSTPASKDGNGFILPSLGYAATPDRIPGSIEPSASVLLAKSLHPKALPQYDPGAVDFSSGLTI